MNPNETKIWFPAKKYGWGWGPPNCWQGWVVVAVYVALVGSGAFLMPIHPVLWFVLLIVLTIALLIVCYLKGEKPGWRWSGK